VATITSIKGKGGVRFRAQIRKFTEGRLLYSEAKTFTKRSQAAQWAAQRESELVDTDAIMRRKVADVTLGALLKQYAEKFCAKAGRTKKADISRLQTYRIAKLPLSRLTSDKMVEHIHERLEFVEPQTANNDLVWIESALRAAYPAFGLKVDLAEIEAAKTLCRKEGMVRKSQRRDRRPSADELAKLDAFFAGRDGRSEIPMRDIMWFAVFSTRRQAEITRLEWADNDEEHQTGLVRDLKHPRKKEGNHKRFKYTPEAWEIVQRQPKVSEFIFPFNPKSIGTAFARACHLLEIKNLRFHDARHDGISRLFEAGYSIPEVQLFSLQESWDVMRRYVNLRPENLKMRPASP
jgi:integrase